jgi:phage FluMu gp28-like protein
MDEADYFNFIRAGCPDEDTFQQEYMCVPSDDASAFLSYELITGCEYKPGEYQDATPDSLAHPMGEGRGEGQHSLAHPMGEGRGEGPLYIGVDVGRDHDLTVIWILQRVGDVCHTRAVITLQAETFDAQEHALYAWLQSPAVRRCCIDQTGIGRQFAERAGARYGKYKVEGVQFTMPVKDELAYPVRAAFEDRTLRIPSDAKIRSDLRAIRKETTASGNVRFTADRGKNGHSDRFWALALALHAAKQNNAPRITVC